ncbi:S-adenosylmethionine decarboxylase [Dehalobacterium formicoaceticum]|uniref:S-adenosylmethionine decarboxylase n=1 Tax=Dehalobacterium formicoaceticum TaxID=51515 RepID=UPI0031F66D62
MRALGRHVLAEFYDCPFEVLNDLKQVERNMVQAALDAGAGVEQGTVLCFKFCESNKEPSPVLLLFYYSIN